MSIRILQALGLAPFPSIPTTHAGILEDLLASPAMQSLRDLCLAVFQIKVREICHCAEFGR